MMSQNETSIPQFKHERKDVGELCAIDEVVTKRYAFQAMVRKVEWIGNSFGSSPYLMLQTAHVYDRAGEYLGTVDTDNEIFIPVTKPIESMGIKPFDVIRFKARLKYNPKMKYCIYVFQARDIEIVGSYATTEKEEVHYNG